MREWVGVLVLAGVASGCDPVKSADEDGGGGADAATIDGAPQAADAGGADAGCSDTPVCADFVTVRTCTNGMVSDTRCMGATPVCEDGACAALAEVTFGQSVLLPNSDSIDRMYLADVNADANLDLVAHLSLVSAESSYFLGGGDQTFAAGMLTTPGAGVAYGDFNHDQKADFVKAKNSLGETWLGDGTGGFTQAPGGPPGDLNNTVQLADLDDDGELDLVYTPTSSSAHQLTLVYGNGDGTFGNGVPISTLSPATGVLVRDADGDGHLDLLAREGSGSVEVFLRTAARSYAAGVTSAAPLVPNANFFLSADFNGDKRADLLSVAATGGALQLMPGNGDGTFADALPVASGLAPKTVGIGDLNGDRRPDIVIVQSQPSLDETFVAIVGRGDFTFKVVTTNVTDTGIRLYMVIGDVDHDRRDEIFYTTAGSSQISMVPNTSP